MSRQLPLALSILALSLFLSARASASTSAGSCPTATNYIDLTNPSNGGGSGSLALSETNAGGITSCYYFSSNGSDTNSCTTEGSPCQHLPGMPNCASTCSGIPLAAGQGFIIEGGSVYHHQAGSPLMGGNWSWNGSGNSSHYIYIGIDPSWYSGGSFARPVISLDNPVSTSVQASCTYAETGYQFSLTGASYVIVDGLEMTGGCFSGTSGALNYIEPGNNSHEIFERLYLHGWSYASGSNDNIVLLGDASNRNDSSIRNLFNVIDGVDSTFGNTCNSPSCVAASGGGGGFLSDAATGWAMGFGYDTEYNVIRHVSNGVQAGNICTLIGNLMEYNFSSGPTISGGHGNVVEANFGSACTVGLYYNNLTRNVNNGIDWSVNASTHYYFNNIWFNDQHYCQDPNGLFPEGPGSNGTAAVTAYVYNNTFQCVHVNAAGPNASWDGWAPGSAIYFGNNQIMDFTSISGQYQFFICSSGSTCTTTQDNGGEDFMTTSVANADGYTISNNYAPTSSSSPTVGLGKNMTSFCDGLSNSLAAADCKNGTSAGVQETSNWGGKFASYPGIAVNARPGSGAWDAGAYQFSASSTPNPPTGLTAAIQ